MKLRLILGPGASRKSTLAARWGEITGLPVIELDKLFCRPGLLPTPQDQWVELQPKLVDEYQWIIDGHLGPYDAVEVRLRAAATIILLDFAFVRCAWRAMRRGRERGDFWLCLWRYRRQSRLILIEAIHKFGSQAELHVLRNPKALEQFQKYFRACRGDRINL